MEKKYIAHINEELKTEQTVKEHSENVAMLAEEYAVERFKKIAYVTGLLHDCGKYQESFQKRISGSDIRVEHSTCGAIIVKDMSENKSRYPLGILSRMMEYCIAGHHSGIPDGGTTNDYETDPTLTGRLKREFEDFSTYKEEHITSTKFDLLNPFSMKKGKSSPNLRSHWSRITSTPCKRRLLASLATHSLCSALSCEYEINRFIYVRFII